MSPMAQEMYVKLIVSSLSYSCHGSAQAVLSKALTSTPEASTVFYFILLCLPHFFYLNAYSFGYFAISKIIKKNFHILVVKVVKIYRNVDQKGERLSCRIF